MASRKPDTQLAVRAVTMDDIDEYCEIFEQPLAIWGTLQRPHLSRAKRAQWLRESLDDDNRSMLGAVIDGRLVGSLGLEVSTNPRVRHIASFGMAVHDDFQGRGAGRALVKAAIDLCDNWLQVRRIVIDCFVDNEPAVALYRSCGFEVEGTHPLAAFRDGEYVATHTMARLRDPA